MALHQQGQLVEAKKMYEGVLKLNPQHAGCWHFLGVMALQSNRLEMAVKYINESLKNNPTDPVPHVNLGLAFKGQGKLTEAIACFTKAIGLSPDFVDASINRGVALAAKAQLSEALSDFDKAIALESENPDALSGRGRVLLSLGRAVDAVADWDKAIALRPAMAEAHNNRGVGLMELKRFGDAMASFETAIACSPDYAEAHYNLGKACEDAGRLNEALTCYEKAIALKPGYTDAHINRANVLATSGRLDEAVYAYQEVFSVNPDVPFLAGALLHTKMKTCDWSNFEARMQHIEGGLKDARSTSMPFPLLALVDSPELHLMTAQLYGAATYPQKDVLGPIQSKRKGNKIRIAYFSSDLHEHPVSQLMVDVFESHDRNKFELFAFDFGPAAGDAMRTRVYAAFNEVIDVMIMSDREVAAKSRALGIDIAINLGGYTQNERTGIFAYRCAPVQVNYLGYPGTMGVNYMDYIVADQTLIPVAMQPHYAEKVVYLPDSHLAYATPPVVGRASANRDFFGLPDAAFVFCCFNNSYKVLPTVFASWMKILRSVPNSVLWLFEANSMMADNLRKEAQAQGVHAARLVFVGRVPREVYLANFSQADLFLDTTPYNAGTTAVDALWAGLPVLTCIGQSFAARMAAGLLTTAGLPEMITCTVDDYEARAIELATHSVQLAALKARLRDGRATNSLFNIPQFTRHLESAYQTMHHRSQSGLPPATFEVMRSRPT